MGDVVATECRGSSGLCWWVGGLVGRGRCGQLVALVVAECALLSPEAYCWRIHQGVVVLNIEASRLDRLHGHGSVALHIFSRRGRDWR